MYINLKVQLSCTIFFYVLKKCHKSLHLQTKIHVITNGHYYSMRLTLGFTKPTLINKIFWGLERLTCSFVVQKCENLQKLCMLHVRSNHKQKAGTELVK